MQGVYGAWIEPDADGGPDGFRDCSAIFFDCDEAVRPDLESAGFEFGDEKDDGGRFVAIRFNGDCGYLEHWVEAAERWIRANGIEVRR
jgi:hypothetical protein